MRGVETGIIELEIHPNSNAANKPVNAIPWPRECLVASIRRGNRLIIPHGETILRAGDVLMVVAEPAAQSQLDRLFRPDVNA
jgi:CIC family chloride channel protein